MTLKTNVDYQVVGSFTIQDETTESVKEALHVLKKWTASRNPKMFMVDNCDEETDAIEIVFPVVLYRFLPKYQFLYQNIYIHLYFCNIISPSLFLLCFWQCTKKINKTHTKCYLWLWNSYTVIFRKYKSIVISPLFHHGLLIQVCLCMKIAAPICSKTSLFNLFVSFDIT